MNLIRVRIQSGGLHIQHDVSHTVEIDVLASLHDFSAVVDHIALAARNQLDADILGRSKSFRKCLHSAVIGNGDGSVSPLCRLFNQIRGVRRNPSWKSTYADAVLHVFQK